MILKVILKWDRPQGLARKRAITRHICVHMYDKIVQPMEALAGRRGVAPTHP
jgi:hypothetical protein